MRKKWGKLSKNWGKLSKFEHKLMEKIIPFDVIIIILLYIFYFMQLKGF